MSGHILPPTGSSPSTLNSAEVVWIRKGAVKQRGRGVGGHRMVSERNTRVTGAGSDYYCTFALPTRKQTPPPGWILPKRSH